MCGIAVVLATQPDSVTTTELARALVQLGHRGPDAHGHALLEQGRLGMAATRLAINDLQAEPQPVRNEDDSVVAVINGELYDFVERAAWLRARGHRLRSHCDAELIVHLYEELGPAFVDELDGDFALVLWDAKAKRLLAARDRMGVRPLFHARTGERIMLASECKALFALGSPAAIDPAYLHGHLLGAYTGHGCAFAGIESLPPGGVWTWTGEREQRSIYWRWPTQRVEHPPVAAEQLLDALERSVARRLRSDARTAVLLSGGLDSAAVAALARMHTDLPAFTLAFAEPRYDESTRTREHAERLAIALETVEVDGEALAAELPDTIAALEFAPINAHCVARRILARHVQARGFKVVLSGEGSDELFAGYPFFMAESRWRAGLEPGEGGSLGAGLLDAPLTRASESRLPWASFLEQRVRSLDEVPPRVLAPAWRRPLRPSALAFAGLDLTALAEAPPLLASRLLALRQLQDYLIPALGDRVEMAHGLEGRPVFLDRAVIELASRCDEAELLDPRSGQGKQLLRKALAPRLPPELASVRKHPFLAPSWRYVLAGARGRALVEQHLDRAALREVGIFDANAIEFVRGQWLRLPPERAAGHRFDWLIGLVLGVQILHARFVAGRASAEG